MQSDQQTAIKQEKDKGEREWFDIQIGSVIPDWARDVSSEGVDKDFILIELENDVREPPGSVPLEALPVAGGSPGSRV